jgi:hypothetical protein
MSVGGATTDKVNVMTIFVYVYKSIVSLLLGCANLGHPHPGTHLNLWWCVLLPTPTRSCHDGKLRHTSPGQPCLKAPYCPFGAVVANRSPLAAATT